MITINLLPEEYRQRSKTPVKVLAAISVAVLVNACLGAWLSWKTFGEAAEVESELAVLEDTMSSLEPQIVYHDALVSEKTQFEAREQTLGEITDSRISWTRKVDELIDLVNDGDEAGTEAGYMIWFDDLTVSASASGGGRGKEKQFGSLAASGHSGSGEFTKIASFFEDIERHELSWDFHPPSHPEGSQATTNDELVPATTIGFPLRLELKPPAERGPSVASLTGGAQ